MGISASMTKRKQHVRHMEKPLKKPTIPVDVKTKDIDDKIEEIKKHDYENLQFYEEIGGGSFGPFHRVAFKTPYKGHVQAVAKSISDLQEDEMKKLRNLHHPNIVTSLGFCRHGPRTWILFEFAENGSLRDYLSDVSKPLPHEMINKWVRELAVAIRYMHAYNILHKRIESQNCLLFQDNVLKLSNHSIIQDIAHSSKTLDTNEMFLYMAPEIIKATEKEEDLFTKPADIFAYGILIFEICTRKPPFEGLGSEEALSQVTSGKSPRLPDDCPDELSHLMQRCCKADPNDRPSIEHIVNELCKWELAREIYLEQNGSSLKPNRIACCPSGEMVVNSWSNDLKVFGADAEYKTSLVSPKENPRKQIGRVEGITVSAPGHILVVDGTKYVKVFDDKGKCLHCFSTVPERENPDVRVDLRCLATDKNGQILVGDCYKGVVTVHSYPMEEVLNTVKCNISYNGAMFTNRKDQIIHHFRPDDSNYPRVVGISQVTGNEVFAFTPKIDEDVTGETVRPRGVVCDADDNIYIAMCVSGTNESGHIHKYSSVGVFIECIAKQVYQPMDLAITPDGSLIVANKRSLLVYSLM